MNRPFRNTRRSLLNQIAGLGAAATCPTLYAAGASSSRAVLAIDEPISADGSQREVGLRYQPLADLISQAVGLKLAPSPQHSLQSFRADLKQRPAFVFSKTVPLLAEQVVQGAYLPLVTLDKPYQAAIVCTQKFQGTDLNSLIGHGVLLPPADSTEARLAIATLRAAGLPLNVLNDYGRGEVLPADKVTLRFLRMQDDVVAWALQKEVWSHVGVVGPAVLASWKGRVLRKFGPQPNWSIGAASDLPAASITSAKLRLMALHESDEGRNALRRIGVDRFVAAEIKDFERLAGFLATAKA